VNLIETLAARLCELCMTDERVIAAEVTVHKPQAPIAREFADVAVTARRRPVPVCTGELDPVTPVGAAEEIACALPEGLARLEAIAGAGHFTWMDAPDRYWPAVTRFFRSVTAPVAAG